MKTGSADLPLHGGHCPRWLFEKMTTLGASIIEAILIEHSREEVLRRLSDPGWFQAFGCALGFDWHSSGLTTVVCGALKEALNPRAHEWGIYVAGGKGSASRRTPRELAEYADREAPSLPVEQLQKQSRRAAQVDTSGLQDGYPIYHHSFVVTRGGQWVVIQQGLNEGSGWARRYHWLSLDVDSFLDQPHAGVCSRDRLQPLNLVHPQSRENRDLCVEISVEDPVNTLQEYRRILDGWDDHRTRLELPARHDLPRMDSFQRAMRRLYDHPAESFEDLMDTGGIGPKTIRALSMVSELVWGARPSYEDPARYSFAHGGKDGHPYPVNRTRYEDSIRILRQSISDAKMGRRDRIRALERLSGSTSSPEPPLRNVRSSGDAATGDAGEKSEDDPPDQLSLPL